MHSATGHDGDNATSDDDDFAISLPFNFQHLTHVRADESAPLGFRGLPPAWTEILARQHENSVTSDEHDIVVSLPFNFQHLTHVQADESAPFGFRGLPPAWIKILVNMQSHG